MLRIKRASAGSGKTYELAKTYIKLLLTSKIPGKKRELLRDGNFRESLSSIMAVTFTVKATAEMKQRIVEKLAELARADKVTPEEQKKIDYLEEFIRDLNSNTVEIADLATKALRTLLLNYSDFKVQTIDSFFQSVLHTFAYEANMEDNYNMEVETDFVTMAGLDSALDLLSTMPELNGKAGGGAKPEAAEFLRWLRREMENKMTSNQWNVFSRNESKKSLYSTLIREAGNLEKEKYKQIRDELNEYFAELEDSFSDVIQKVDEANIDIWKPYHEKRREKAQPFAAALAKAGLKPQDISGRLGTQLTNSLLEFDSDMAEAPTRLIAGRKRAEIYSLKENTEAELNARIQANPELASLAGELNRTFDEWAKASNEYYTALEPQLKGVKTWLQYRKLLPMLMILLEVARQKEQYLKATNSLQISDTTHILQQIIGDDDTPFVYERMGARLSHYLIDEFQDTSRMQWDNLRPLLLESDSREEDNLIIGDTKQSIYRFRNADYTLLGSLEKSGEFNKIVHYTQEEKPKEMRNFNYRSKPEVVDFNNSVFGRITGTTIPTGNKKEKVPLFTPEIRAIYDGCEQEVPKSKRMEGKPQGYVEVVIYKKTGDSETDEDVPELEQEPGFAEIPVRILELRSRGYRFRDIGILVKSHNQGAAVVGVISRYNALHKESPIPLVSEDNLLLTSSLSVKIIIHALEIAAGYPVKATKENPVLKDPVDREELFSLLHSLNTLALPSVVEAIIGRFVPAHRREGEAPFIAAFQDAVLDYTSGHSSDIGSFLKWWRRKSKTLSITSPEDSDGVILQTIHKAKGLEYNCVIIPKADFKFTPGSFKEWRWVKPDSSVALHDKLPPYLPVTTCKDLAATAHEAEYTKYREEFALDELNKMYVAFTRPVSELYVYTPLLTKEADKTAGGVLLKLLAPEGKKEEERLEVKFGSPSTPQQISLEGEKKHTDNEVRLFNGFQTAEVGKPGPDEEEADEKSLLFRNDHPLKTIVHPDGREEEIDPRAEGTLKHRILQMVNVPADLDKALLRLKVEGMISPAQVEEWGADLRAALRSEEAAEWFSPEMRVFNERPLLKKGEHIHRPDRFVVSPEGDAVIIDYKFGDEGSYKRQILEYANLLRQTGLFRSVEAYLWYVQLGKVEKVEI